MNSLNIQMKKNKQKNNLILVSDLVIDFYKKLAGNNYKKKINEDLEKLVQSKT